MFSVIELGLSTVVHRSLKKSLNKFGFSLKSVIILLVFNNGDLTDIFVPFTDVYKTGQ